MGSENKHMPLLDMQFVTASISTTLVLLLLGLVAFFVLAAHNLSVYVKENIVFSVLLDDDMAELDALRFQQTLNQQPFVKSTDYISKEEALQIYTEDLGVDPQEFLDSNPLIASIEVKLSSQYANSDSIAKIEQFIKQENNIRELQYRKDLLDDVNRNIGRISILLLSLAAILALISFALINNTIKLTIYAKRFLIHTMKLVGASWGFIRRPFLVRNFKVGVLSAVLADGLLWCGAHWLVSYEPGLEAVVTLRVMVLVSVVVLAFGVFITWLCALLSINKFLRMKAGTLYYV